MPGGAGGQFLAFDQNDVGPALFGQVIERGATNGPSTDNHDTRVRLHERSPACVLGVALNLGDQSKTGAFLSFYLEKP